MSTSVSSKPKRSFLWLHVLITLYFMFGFGYLAPIGSITPIGMKFVGIFIGLVYAWSATSLLWPSLLGMVAICATGAFSMAEFFKISFGNDTIIFLIFLLVFATAIGEAGLIRYISAWMMTRKIIAGRPWLFTFFILFGAFIGGAFVSTLASALIFWNILYVVCKLFDYKPYEKYPSLMIFGIVFASMTLGGSVLPFKLAPLIFLGTLQATTGLTVGYMQYVCFSFPIGILLILTYLLICKFVFRVNLDKMKAINSDFVDQKDLILDKKQKTAFGFLIAMVILLLAPDLLPAQFALTIFLKQLGSAGIMILLTVIMLWIKVEGEPIMPFRKMAGIGMDWDMIILFAIILPLSNLLTHDMTGVKPFMIELLSPIFAGRSSIVFIFLILLISTVITNFANNAVLGVIFINILCPMAVPLGINPIPVVIVMVFTIQLAYMTPAASAPAAFVFGNTAWIKPSQMYGYLALSLVLMFLITLAVGLPLANILF